MHYRAKNSHDGDVALAKMNALAKSWARFMNDPDSFEGRCIDCESFNAVNCLLSTMVEEVEDGWENLL